MKFNPSLPKELHDFRNFQFLMWKHLRWPNPDKVAVDIAYTLQHGPRRLAINAYRAATKTATSVGYANWRLLHDPELKILISSAGGKFASNISRWMWQLLNEMPILAHLRPNKEQRQSILQFDVAGCLPSKEPSVQSVGVEGQITGNRIDLIILDDVETKQNTETLHLRDKLAGLVVEYENILRDPKDSRFLVLGTPHTEESLYREIEKRGFKTVMWPQRYPTQEDLALDGHRYAPSILKAVKKDPSLMSGGGVEGTLGKPVNEDRFGEIACQEKEASVGSREYGLQYLLRTNPETKNRYPLKLRNLIVTDLDSNLAPQTVLWSGAQEYALDLPVVGFSGDRYYRPWQVGEAKPYVGKILTLDPAGAGQDEIAYCVSGMLNSQIFILDCHGIWSEMPERRGATEENLRLIAQIAARYGVDKVRIEDNFGDMMLEKLLLPYLLRAGAEAGKTIGIETEKSVTSKELRIIESLDQVMTQHRLVVNRSVVERDYRDRYRGSSEDEGLARQLFYQMTHIYIPTRDRRTDGRLRSVRVLEHDDRIDALAMSVRYWTNYMSQDREKSVARQQEQDRKRETELWLAGVDERTRSRHHPTHARRSMTSWVEILNP